MWVRCLLAVALAALTLAIAHSQDCTGLHEEYFNCTSPCQKSCSTRAETVENCRGSCVSGCFCSAGYFRREDSLCVRSWACSNEASKRKPGKLSRNRLE
uniref:TIL domain-containing protein n=1 Tax=Anopheles atroparvus TaxID=41427 RepID=A0AAG5D8P9_ANOAO